MPKSGGGSGSVRRPGFLARLTKTALKVTREGGGRGGGRVVSGWVEERGEGKEGATVLQGLGISCLRR